MRKDRINEINGKDENNVINGNNGNNEHYPGGVASLTTACSREAELAG